MFERNVQNQRTPKRFVTIPERAPTSAPMSEPSSPCKTIYFNEI